MEQVKLLMTDLGAPVTKQCCEALASKGVAVTVCEKDGRKALAAIEMNNQTRYCSMPSCRGWMH